MVLLVMIALAMLSLSTIELRSSQQKSAIQEARANARMALLIAVGQLQKTMGPDTRISARAETLVMDSRISDTVSPNIPQAWWVGVMHSDHTKMMEGAKPVVWLVSGLDPAKNISDPQPFKEDKPVELMGSKSLNLTALTGGQAISAGRVYVSNPRGQRTGAYAYWVDDNGFDENYWTGFRNIKPEEVRELAEKIVEKIKKRGPFLSMGEFVNRKLDCDNDLGGVTVSLDIER